MEVKVYWTFFFKFWSMDYKSDKFVEGIGLMIAHIT